MPRAPPCLKQLKLPQRGGMPSPPFSPYRARPAACLTFSCLPAAPPAGPARPRPRRPHRPRGQPGSPATTAAARRPLPASAPWLPGVGRARSPRAQTAAVTASSASPRTTRSDPAHREGARGHRESLHRPAPLGSAPARTRWLSRRKTPPSRHAPRRADLPGSAPRTRLLRRAARREATAPPRGHRGLRGVSPSAGHCGPRHPAARGSRCRRSLENVPRECAPGPCLGAWGPAAGCPSGCPSGRGVQGCLCPTYVRAVPWSSQPPPPKRCPGETGQRRCCGSGNACGAGAPSSRISARTSP